MALRKSKQAANRVPALSADGAADTLPLVFEHVVVTTEFALNDVIEMGALPAGMILLAPPVLVTEDLDTGATLTLDVGLMTGDYLAALDGSGAARTCGAEFFAGTTIGQTGGLVTSAVAAGMRLTPSLVDRSIGVKIASAAAGNVAGAKIRLHVLVAAAPVGIN